MSLIRPRTLHRTRAGQRGSMMLLVAMLSTVSLGLIMVAFRTTDDAIETQQFQNERDLKNHVVTTVLARGAALLRTGEVPKKLEYVETYDLPDGGVFYTVVKIEREGKPPKGSPLGANGYTIEVKPGDQKDLIKHGPRPASLEGDGNNGGGNDD